MSIRDWDFRGKKAHCCIEGSYKSQGIVLVLCTAIARLSIIMQHDLIELFKVFTKPEP